MKLWTVDAFTDKPYAGNPAAVAIVEEFPTHALCQKIAAEMNLSETAFLKPLAMDHFHIRWFTPQVEVKLCGHATLASAHILFQEKLVSDKITFDSLSGPLFVHQEGNSIVLDFPLQKPEKVLSLDQFKTLFSKDSIKNAAQAHDDIIVELIDEALVRKFKLTPAITEAIKLHGLIITAKGQAPYDFVSRFFAPHEGIAEDPVTGSAHCKLAPYWQKILEKEEFLAYQASARGGEIGVRIVGDRVHLKGHATTMMEGTWKG